MSNFGVILKTSLKNNVNPVSGEMQYASDTDELVVNSGGQIQARPNKVDDSRYPISIGSGIPSGGLSGDWYIDTDTVSSELMEYFKITNWVARPEGYTESYITTNFATKVDWSGYITRDGSVKVDGTAYDNAVKTPFSMVTKYEADTIISNLSSLTNGIGVDGNDGMTPSYEPTLDQDVLDIKSLKSGNLYFIPPTTMPLIAGAIWNDNGTPRIVPKGVPIGTIEDAIDQTGSFPLYDLGGSQFGRALDMSSTRIIVGSQVYNEPDSGNYTGAAWLFDKASGNLITRLLPATTQSWQQFGWTTAISEDRVIVGSNYGYNENGDQTGVVYIYDNDGVLINAIYPHDYSQYLSFGIEVAVFGDRIAVGTDSTSDGVKVYVYDKNGIFLHIISAPEAIGPIGSFSQAIGISDSLIVVGDPMYSEYDNTNETGKAWIYDLNGNLITPIDPPVIQEQNTWGGHFGFRIEVSSTHIFISHASYDYEEEADDRFGRVYVFNTSGTLVDTIDCPSGGGREFGMSLDVSSDGSVLAIGDWNGNNDTGDKTGNSWIYDVATKSLTKIVDPTWDYGDSFGSDVAVEGGLLLCGSFSKNYDGSGEDGSVVKFLI